MSSTLLINNYCTHYFLMISSERHLKDHHRLKDRDKLRWFFPLINPTLEEDALFIINLLICSIECNETMRQNTCTGLPFSVLYIVLHTLVAVSTSS